MLIRNIEFRGKPNDLRVCGGLIAEIGCQLARQDGEQVIDGQSGALLPGLHDHHIHLNASAAALGSVRCGPPNVQNAKQFIEALHAAPDGNWIRGIGYHPLVAGEIDRDWLDANAPERPIRVQHRGGRMWVFNSPAMALLDIEIPADGRLIDGDAKLRKVLGSRRPDLKPLVKQLLSFGITGVTEVTPGNNRDDFEHYAANAKPLNLTVMGGADLHDHQGNGAQVGPLKIHNHDYDLPPLANLTAQIADAHDHDRAVAIHCVTRAEMMLSLVAIEEAGVHPQDRIEHAAIADNAIIDWIARLGLTVVTQPHFITERQYAYLREVESRDQPDLWRLNSFLNAGVKLAGGSDAPFGDLNPWEAMASAMHRPSKLGPDEAIRADDALALYTKPPTDAGAAPRKIAIGERADLCLLDRSWLDACADFSAVNVRATWVGGELVYDKISSTNPHSSAV